MHKPLPTGSIITLDSLRHSRKHIPMRTSESIRPTAYPVHARPINTVPEVGTLKIHQYRHLRAVFELSSLRDWSSEIDTLKIHQYRHLQAVLEPPRDWPLSGHVRRRRRKGSPEPNDRANRRNGIRSARRGRCMSASYVRPEPDLPSSPQRPEYSPRQPDPRRTATDSRAAAYAPQAYIAPTPRSAAALSCVRAGRCSQVFPYGPNGCSRGCRPESGTPYPTPRRNGASAPHLRAAQ